MKRSNPRWRSGAMALLMAATLLPASPAAATESMAMPIPSLFLDGANNEASFDLARSVVPTLRTLPDEITRRRIIDEIGDTTFVFDMAFSETAVLLDAYPLDDPGEDRTVIRVSPTESGYRWDLDSLGSDLPDRGLLEYDSDIELAINDDLPFCDGACGFAALGVATTVGGGAKAACTALDNTPIVGKYVGVPCMLGATALGGEARARSDLMCDRQFCGEPILSADPRVDLACYGTKPTRYCRARTTVTRESEYDNYVADLDTTVTWIRRRSDGSSADIKYPYDDSQQNSYTTFDSYNGVPYYRATLFTDYSQPHRTLQSCAYSIIAETDVKYLRGRDGSGSDSELYAGDVLLGPPSCP